VKDTTDEEEKEIENVEIVNTSTQTDTDSSDIPEGVDTSMRIKELEEAVMKAKEGERAARAEVIRKDIELSRAIINAQKRTANEEKHSIDPKKSKFSENDDLIKSEESEIFPQSVSTNEVATDKPTESHLSVNEMLQDFSAKLNSNLLQTNFAADSDSE